MSQPSISPDLKPVWTPEDARRTAEDAARIVEQDEFNADMAYLRGLANALFEYATPAHIAKMAEDAGIS